MNPKVIAVLNGYLNLNSSEKLELEKLIKENNSLDHLGQIRNKERLNEDVKRVTGPSAANSCTCCGR